MNADNVIQIIRREIALADAQGVEQVSLANLTNLADILDEEAKKTPQDVSVIDARLEQFKAQLVREHSEEQRAYDASLEMQRATIATGELALKSTLLINGGAAVAFLAFLGNAWSKIGSASAKLALATALEMFVFGVIATGVGIAFAYIAQAGFGDEFGEHSDWIGAGARAIAIVLVFLSFFLFYLGCRSATAAFLNGTV